MAITKEVRTLRPLELGRMAQGPIPFQIALARRILAREGCESATAGQVSVRAPGEDAFWVSPFEYFDESLPERVVKSSFDLQRLEGDWEPSPAVKFHAAFYRGRPDVNCVIHTHSHHAMVFATTGRPLGLYSDMSSIFLDEQAVYVEDGARDPLDGAAMCSEVGAGHVVIMKNHGPIFLGSSIEQATVSAIAFEHAARIQIEAEGIGGTEHPRQYAEWLKATYYDYYFPQMWAAGVRRLRRDDAEFFLHEPETV
jgi:L-fuculose-phosphate aldolase